mmetsp:Transcript_32510/g.100604  ORF Transcript_32510/g.100604 Transcript_32510/m.100604 type:complete len:241 (-) Transcript_32510:408-1130(-)
MGFGATCECVAVPGGSFARMSGVYSTCSGLPVAVRPSGSSSRVPSVASKASASTRLGVGDGPGVGPVELSVCRSWCAWASAARWRLRALPCSALSWRPISSSSLAKSTGPALAAAVASSDRTSPLLTAALLGRPVCWLGGRGGTLDVPPPGLRSDVGDGAVRRIASGPAGDGAGDGRPRGMETAAAGAGVGVLFEATGPSSSGESAVRTTVSEASDRVARVASWLLAARLAAASGSGASR